MLELIVVIAVVVVLTGMLMPAMRQLHENAHRVICMANLQQMGQGILLYENENKDRLPYSATLHEDWAPQNLMVAHRFNTAGGNWDGLGLLFHGQYCGAAECFYCPSHRGQHPFERYADQWQSVTQPTMPIYTNYHYAGDIEWRDSHIRRKRDEGGARMVLVTDGLRTASDFNHVVGMNVLLGDLSVRWREDTQNIYNQLPRTESLPPTYFNLWSAVESTQ